MTPFRKIIVCGTGLIGGSFALSLKAAGVKSVFAGMERSREALSTAKTLGIVDEMPETMEELFAGADLFVLAAPVAQTAPILEKILPYVTDNLLITDTGSTKRDVVAAARSVLGDRVRQFIPAHPIAGSEKNGPTAAFVGLFDNRKTVITALPENRPEDVEKVASLWKLCGSVIHRLTPEEHDKVFATVSHMPHLLAYALVDYIERREDSRIFFEYAASGFRDFTRIAESSPEMWRDISLANREALLFELDNYISEIIRLRESLDKGDGQTLYRVFENARAARAEWINTIESIKKT